MNLRVRRDTATGHTSQGCRGVTRIDIELCKPNRELNMFKPSHLAASALVMIAAILLLPGCVPVEDAADAVTRDLIPPVAAAQEEAPAAPEARVLLQRTFTVDEILGRPGRGRGDIVRRSIEQFAPNEVGSKITVRLSGNATGSRLLLTVADGSGDVVINEDNPLTNESAAEFISTTTAEHSINVRELGQPSALYTLIVTEE